MNIHFLGTGAAWRVPEHSCSCAICNGMREAGEERLRSSFLIDSGENILVDCGPDFRDQMSRADLKKPDLVLITHEHADHFSGLDDLLAFKRSMPKSDWTAIPVYATGTTWNAIEARFGYLVNSLLTKIVVEPGIPFETATSRITPFKTFHGPTAAGSLGYILECRSPVKKIVYTSDFTYLPEEPELIFNADILITQAVWVNEPEFNRPSHMSLQNIVPLIARWTPQKTYLIHMSDGDSLPGDPGNDFMKKIPPKAPFTPPGVTEPYRVPRNQNDWELLLESVRKDYNIAGPIVPAFDGMMVNV